MTSRQAVSLKSRLYREASSPSSPTIVSRGGGGLKLGPFCKMLLERLENQVYAHWSRFLSWPPVPSFLPLVHFQTQFSPPVYAVPDVPHPSWPPALLFCPCPCPLTPAYTQLHCCLNVIFETTEGHAVFAASQRKKIFFDPFGVKSTYKKYIQGPSPASFNGVVRIWWLVI